MYPDSESFKRHRAYSRTIHSAHPGTRGSFENSVSGAAFVSNPVALVSEDNYCDSRYHEHLSSFMISSLQVATQMSKD